MSKYRHFLSLIVLIVFSLLALSGCSNNSDLYDELQQDIIQLESRVNQLELQNESPAYDTGGTLFSDTDTTLTISNLTTSINAINEKINASVPPSSTDGKMNQYLTLKKEVSEANEKIGAYNNTLERQYRSGTLSMSDYQSKERELDALEEKLDTAKAELKDKYRIEE